MADTGVVLTGNWRGGSFTMREPPDYEAIEQRLWRENAGDVLARMTDEDRDLMKRIRTYMWRFGYEEDEVKGRITDDKMFAAWFSKEPRRQGLHEVVAANWLRQADDVAGFDVLHKSGPSAYYITSDGEIRRGMHNPPGKSIDFYWTTGETGVYAYHKYTKEGGGNQDSQFTEMKDALGRFQRSAERNKILLVIVDGPYYTRRKMDDLQRFVRDQEPRSFVCHIEDVPGIIARYA